MILLIANIIIGICLFALFTSIMINFTEEKNTNTKKEKRA